MQDKVSARNMRISQKLDLLERQSMQLGAKAERERIIKFLEDEADKFDAMRPEWYKSVADKMDARIRTIRAIAKKLKEEQDV